MPPPATIADVLALAQASTTGHFRLRQRLRSVEDADPLPGHSTVPPPPSFAGVPKALSVRGGRSNPPATTKEKFRRKESTEGVFFGLLYGWWVDPRPDSPAGGCCPNCLPETSASWEGAKESGWPPCARGFPAALCSALRPLLVSRQVCVWPVCRRGAQARSCAFYSHVK